MSEPPVFPCELEVPNLEYSKSKKADEKYFPKIFVCMIKLQFISTCCDKSVTLLHENFAVFWGKIAFRGILISRFRQIDEFRGILISRFEQKIRISRHFNFAVQVKNEKSK